MQKVEKMNNTHAHHKKCLKVQFLLFKSTLFGFPVVVTFQVLLAEAIEAKNIAAVKKLLHSVEVDPASNDNTPFGLACQAGTFSEFNMTDN